VRIVIAGCGAAGLTAASYARRTNPDAEIIIAEGGRFPAYSRCGLPLLLSGEVKKPEDLLFASPDWYRLNRLELLLQSPVEEVEAGAKKVRLGGSNPQEIHYDSLILCTGSLPVIPSVPGVDLENVFVLRSLEDAIKISEAMESHRSAVIVGAGAIGLEVASALNQRGLEVRVVERFPQVLEGWLDPEMSREVEEHLAKKGIHLLLNSPLEAVEGSGKVEGVVAGGKHLACGLAIVAVGTRPQIELAQRIGLKIDEQTRGILVNERMETSREGIYAAGDCAVAPSHFGGAVSSQLGTTAVRQGRVAGINAAGGSAIFPPLVGNLVCRLPGLEIASTGLTERRAGRLGIECVSVSAEMDCRPRYSPEKLRLRIKLISARDGRLIGGQIIGPAEAQLRAQMLSSLIASGKDVGWLASMETGYHPLTGEAVEPLCALSEVLLRKLQRIHKTLQTRH